jgi:hypothetical protein
MTASIADSREWTCDGCRRHLRVAVERTPSPDPHRCFPLQLRCACGKDAAVPFEFSGTESLNITWLSEWARLMEGFGDLKSKRDGH